MMREYNKILQKKNDILTSLLTPELRKKYDDLIQGNGYITPTSSEQSEQNDLSIDSIEKELDKMAIEKKFHETAGVNNGNQQEFSSESGSSGANIFGEKDPGQKSQGFNKYQSDSARSKK